MRAYFKGDIAIIDTLPVATSGTEFQSRIWQALRKIDRGTTITYAELARRIGKPKAIRAAGLANGQNPISIVVPCHRGDRQQRHADRLWRRPAAQEVATGARGGDVGGTLWSGTIWALKKFRRPERSTVGA